MQKYTKTREFHYEISRFRSILEKTPEITKLHQTQEIIAQIKGFKSWYDFQTLYKQEHTFIKNALNSIDKEIYNLWSTMLEKDEIETIDFLPRPQSIFKIKKENKEAKYPIFIGIKKGLFINSLEDINLLNKDFPLFVSGSSGSGKTELLNKISHEAIKSHKGVIILDGNGDYKTTIDNYFFAQKHQRENDFFVLNLIYDGSGKKPRSNSINPIETLMINYNKFSIVFGDNISKWLYPALKSYEKKGKKVSLKSLSSLLKLPQMLVMANSEDWNNQTEIREYLDTIEFPITEDLTDEEIKKVAIHHTINCTQALLIIEQIKIYFNNGVFSDFPDISLLDIIKNKKILFINFPQLDRCSEEFLINKNLIHHIVSIADDIEGSDENFILFNENSSPLEMKSNKVILTQDIPKYYQEIKNFNQFCGIHMDNYWENTSEVNKYLKYESFFIMKTEDVMSLTDITDTLLNRFWGYKNLDDLRLKTTLTDFKEQLEGKGFLITVDKEKQVFSIQKIMSGYEKRNYNHIMLEQIIGKN